MGSSPQAGRNCGKVGEEGEGFCRGQPRGVSIFPVARTVEEGNTQDDLETAVSMVVKPVDRILSPTLNMELLCKLSGPSSAMQGTHNPLRLTCEP